MSARGLVSIDDRVEVSAVSLSQMSIDEVDLVSNDDRVSLCESIVPSVMGLRRKVIPPYGTNGHVPGKKKTISQVA